VVAFPVTAPDGTTTDDPRAFISHDTVGQIGVKFGVLANARDAGVASNGNVFVRAVPESAPSHEDIKIEPARSISPSITSSPPQSPARLVPITAARSLLEPEHSDPRSR
jgi:hypothetical protein